ncbi:hypothetical protein BB558_005314 [Smittium angustum]|uniref:Uncharacterized protein n=1 Tax=Smittium angustum TaxID=133377 RepID=A0A2U1J0V2_SMIAN|nr:hypothetical protein BB558_005314 [Smittium angustum]
MTHFFTPSQKDVQFAYSLSNHLKTSCEIDPKSSLSQKPPFDLFSDTSYILRLYVSKDGRIDSVKDTLTLQHSDQSLKLSAKFIPALNNHETRIDPHNRLIIDSNILPSSLKLFSHKNRLNNHIITDSILFLSELARIAHNKVFLSYNKISLAGNALQLELQPNNTHYLDFIERLLIGLEALEKTVLDTFNHVYFISESKDISQDYIHSIKALFEKYQHLNISFRILSNKELLGISKLSSFISYMAASPLLLPVNTLNHGRTDLTLYSETPFLDNNDSLAVQNTSKKLNVLSTPNHVTKRSINYKEKHEYISQDSDKIDSHLKKLIQTKTKDNLLTSVINHKTQKLFLISEIDISDYSIPDNSTQITYNQKVNLEDAINLDESCSSTNYLTFENNRKILRNTNQSAKMVDNRTEKFNDFLKKTFTVTNIYNGIGSFNFQKLGLLSSAFNQNLSPNCSQLVPLPSLEKIMEKKTGISYFSNYFAKKLLGGIYSTLKLPFNEAISSLKYFHNLAFYFMQVANLTARRIYQRITQFPVIRFLHLIKNRDLQAVSVFISWVCAYFVLDIHISNQFKNIAFGYLQNIKL